MGERGRLCVMRGVFVGAVAVFLLGLLGLFPFVFDVAGVRCFVEVVVEEGGSSECGAVDYCGGNFIVYRYADKVEKAEKE